MKPINVLSLFDGISCAAVALERAGIPINYYYASEISANAIRVSQRNYPQIMQIGNVEHVQGGDSPVEIDLLVGGSPCQGFSFAGDRLNFNDPRSKLLFDFIRIKNELNPKWFLLENVKMNIQYEVKIDELMGVPGIHINSADFSAQNRQRIYWTNIPIAAYEKSPIVLNDILHLGWVSDRSKSYVIDANYGKGSNFRRYFNKASRQIVFRDGRIPAKPMASWANALQRQMIGDWRILSHVECERLQTLPDGYTDILSNSYDRYEVIGNGWTVDVVAHIFRGMRD